MNEQDTARSLSAEYPLAEVEVVRHWKGPRLSAKIPYGSGHVIVVGSPAEVAAWLMENYHRAAGAPR